MDVPASQYIVGLLRVQEVYRLRSLILSALRCALCLTSFVAHAELQTQHILDSSFAIGPVEPLWHVRVRTTPQGGGIAQIRTGPILNFDVHDKVTLISGYYYTRDKDEGLWTTTHRFFGGVEVAAWERKVEIDVRSLIERFAEVSARDNTRFRNRMRISRPGTTAPYIGVEFLVRTDGRRSMRYSTGIRRNLTKALLVDVGYFYENRMGSDRHVLGTTIHWRDKSKRIDADR